ncbi:hypothetical protein EZV62_002467 [Acer yangbiense]|uniref:CCHC-type domain-containing protein n=1 Tax=Acer yangbiense TaxID=1000413 RepID=A0A5C7IXM0_9ROSI|nr:hypothetical protein EZV62_002467 [Acer yangbiense]
MGTKELARLWENLSIKDEDSEIHQVSEGLGKEGVEDVDHCLVGKVLSRKRVNREAFKSVIEQLWSPFGIVEIEVVGENIFMFYFSNPEVRNQIWRRGPWHFDKSLIVLVQLEGTGDISQLRFDKAEFWVQIHDIPIICMNKRMAKWLAEQIGRVIEIPMESRECWGKFLRVKVLIDISRPLKRWLRLKLDKSDNVVVVGLKYERLSEFCYACGRVGHGVNDCTDGDAKKDALDGSMAKFGSWLRAVPAEKVMYKSSSQGSGRSSGKKKTSEENREASNKETPTLENSSVALPKGGSENSTTAASAEGEAKSLEPLPWVEIAGGEETERICIDRPLSGPVQGSDGSPSRMPPTYLGPAMMGDKAYIAAESLCCLSSRSNELDQEQSDKLHIKTDSQVQRKKWKWAAKEAQKINGQSNSSAQIRERGTHGHSKRKVNFEILDEERKPKKGKAIVLAASSLNLIATAEPVE